MKDPISSRTPDDLNQDGVQILTRHLRTIEVGYLGLPTKMDFSIYFETFPSWLLGLNKHNVRQILIKGHANMSSLLQTIQSKGYSTTILNQIVT